MFSSHPSKSLAGTWGNEINQKSFADKPPGKGLTITRESYNTINIMKEKEHIKNKFVKFRAMKSSGSSLIDVNKYREKMEQSNSENKLCESLSHSVLTLERTKSKLFSQQDAPVAIGRSGYPIEKGVNVSGLLGERLVLDSNPAVNSLVQRSWIYGGDPALRYRLKHVKNEGLVDVSQNPETATSFNIGDETKGKTFRGWNNHRKRPVY